MHRLRVVHAPEKGLPVMRISARNILAGKVVEIRRGAVTSHVRLDVDGTIVTSSITNEAVDDLALKVGEKAYAVIKSSDVLIGKDHG